MNKIFIIKWVSLSLIVSLQTIVWTGEGAGEKSYGFLFSPNSTSAQDKAQETKQENKQDVKAKQVPKKKRGFGDQNYVKDSNELQLSIEGPIDAEFAPIVGKLTTLFYECYPKLLKRFDNPKLPSAKHVKLRFRPAVNVPAYCVNDTITISMDWLKKHPEDIGLLTHELTHVVQHYPGGQAGWMVEGIADYARFCYGPETQPGWSWNRRLGARNKFDQSYTVTGKFLWWLEEHYPKSVDKLHQNLQNRTFSVDDFKTITGKEINELWEQCLKDQDKNSKSSPKSSK